MANFNFSKFRIIFLLLSIAVKLTFSDVFTAVVKLEYLGKVEEQMVAALERYTKQSAEEKYEASESVLT